jgi:hypothetical protein
MLSFQTVASGDKELQSAEAEAGAELVGDSLYRIVFGRVGSVREHPGDHRKVRVEMTEIVTLFVGVLPQVLIKQEGTAWRVVEAG